MSFFASSAPLPPNTAAWRACPIENSECLAAHCFTASAAALAFSFAISIPLSAASLLVCAVSYFWRALATPGANSDLFSRPLLHGFGGGLGILLRNFHPAFRRQLVGLRCLVFLARARHAWRQFRSV